MATPPSTPAPRSATTSTPGDSETYYILSGKGLYNDNGTEVEIGAGDVTYCAPGEGHGLKCLGDEPVEMIALILYE